MHKDEEATAQNFLMQAL